MRRVVLTLLAVVFLVSTANSRANAQSGAAQEDKRMHVETTFDVVVQAPYEETAKLFSPEGERVWAGENWDPQFLHPLPGKDTQGAVFTISHGSIKAVWLIAQHDLEAKHFQYVYFIADVMVTTIDVQFRVVDLGTTQVTVKYARTSVSPQGDSHVLSMSESDRAACKEWQAAIDEYLSARKTGTRN